MGYAHLEAGGFRCLGAPADGPGRMPCGTDPEGPPSDGCRLGHRLGTLPATLDVGPPRTGPDQRRPGGRARTVVARAMSCPGEPIDRSHRVRRIDPRRFGGDLRAARRLAGRSARSTADRLAAVRCPARPDRHRPAVAGAARSLPVVRLPRQGLAVTLRRVRRCAGPRGRHGDGRGPRSSPRQLAGPRAGSGTPDVDWSHPVTGRTVPTDRVGAAPSGGRR